MANSSNCGTVASYKWDSWFVSAKTVDKANNDNDGTEYDDREDGYTAIANCWDIIGGSSIPVPALVFRVTRAMRRLWETGQCNRPDKTRSGIPYLYGNCRRYVERWLPLGLLTRRGFRSCT
jgi:hypothetical protein